jgi:phosphate:Na+ symporter
LQADKEAKKFGDVVGRMFDLTYDYIMDEAKDTHQLAKIRNYEVITDNMERDLTLYIGQVMQKQLSAVQSIDAQVVVRLADELESCADYLEKLANFETRFSKSAKWDSEAREDFEMLLKKVKEFFFLVYHMQENIETLDVNLVIKRRDEIKLMANNIRDRHMARMAQNRYEPVESALTYSDMIVALRKIAAHTSNLCQALSRVGEFDS